MPASKSGSRATYPSGKAAAREFYGENAAFFDNVRDPVDGVRDFLDGLNDRRGRRVSETTAGRKILAERSGRKMIEGALALVFAQPRRKRWDAVDWHEVRRLEESLSPFYEPYGQRSAQSPTLVWKPLAAVTDEDVGSLAPEVANLYYAQKHKKNLRELVSRLSSTFEARKGCLTPPQRKHVKARIREWTRWAKDPARVPAYACDPDPKSGGMLCDYPRIEGELARLRDACRSKYDPEWIELERGRPGFQKPLRADEQPLLPVEAFEDEAPKEPCTVKEAAGVMGRHAARRRQRKPRRPQVIMGRLVT